MLLNQKAVWVFLVLCLFPNHLSSQKTYKVKATFSSAIPLDISFVLAKKTFIENAKTKAIEEKFGTVIEESNRRVLESVLNEEGYEDTQRFYSTTETLLRGVWIEDVKEPICEKEIKNEDIYLTCKVEGKIQEIVNVPVRFSTYLLRCPKLDCRTDTFKNGENFFLKIRSPLSGYLVVYTQFDETVQQLLPYPKMKQSYLKIERDKDYTLFSKKHLYEGAEEHETEEYVAYTDKYLSPEKIIIIFSENPIVNSVMEGGRDKVNTNIGLPPPQTTASLFSEWMQQLRTYNKTIQVKHIYYTIQK